MTPTEMHIQALMEKISALQAENARYREALEFYADPWRPDSELDEDIGPWGADTETGHLARQALGYGGDQS